MVELLVMVLMEVVEVNDAAMVVIVGCVVAVVVVSAADSVVYVTDVDVVLLMLNVVMDDATVEVILVAEAVLVAIVV